MFHARNTGKSRNRRTDYRTRHDRTRRHTQAFDNQMSALTDAYMDWHLVHSTLDGWGFFSCYSDVQDMNAGLIEIKVVDVFCELLMMYWLMCIADVCIRHWKNTAWYSFNRRLHRVCTRTPRRDPLFSYQPNNCNNNGGPQFLSDRTSAQPAFLNSGLCEDVMWPARCAYLIFFLYLMSQPCFISGSILSILFTSIFHRTWRLLTNSR